MNELGLIIQNNYENEINERRSYKNSYKQRL